MCAFVNPGHLGRRSRFKFYGGSVLVLRTLSDLWLLLDDLVAHRVDKLRFVIPSYVFVVDLREVKGLCPLIFILCRVVSAGRFRVMIVGLFLRR